MMVSSPKTKKQGKPKRPVPIFDELRPYLAECFELAEPVSEFVMNRYRSLSGAYIRKRLEVQIERAGLKPWRRIFHNLRASRQTDLTDSHPEHVACAWIGNTQGVARRHYEMVTDDHFAKATQTGQAKPTKPIDSESNVE
jgi:hypothetical protein